MRIVFCFVTAIAMGLIYQSPVYSSINLTAISTAFNAPIGIDHHAPTNSLLVTSRYPHGLPFNFELIDSLGVHTPFSSIFGLTNEIKVATARPGNPGGWASGTAFTGTGVAGQLLIIAPDGLSTTTVNLPGGTGLLRGSTYVDRTGVYGGDVIVVTTTGQVWRVANDVGHTATLLSSVGTHLEGLITVPNDPAYGPLAGRIIAGAEGLGRLYVFDNSGLVTFHSIGVNIEDIDLIPENENFYGINFGTNSLLGAAADQFNAYEGQILLTQEFHSGTSGLFALRWDGGSLVTEEIQTTGAPNGQWEHVTFSPAGIVEIPPSQGHIPEPSTIAIWSILGCIGLAIAHRRRRR